MAVLQPVGVEAHYLRSAENIDKVGLDASTLVAAVMRRREEAVVTPQEFKLDETLTSLTRIDVGVDHVGTEQPDSLPSLDIGKRALQTHDLAHDGDDDELNYGGSDSPRGVEHHISSFSAYTYPENLSHTLSLDLPARQPAGYNSTIGSEHDPTSTSLKSAQPTRPPFLTANSQLSQAIDKRSHERVPQLDTAIKVAEREYGAVTDLPPPVPPKAPLRNSHLPRPSSVYSFASSSNTSHDNTRPRQRSARLATATGRRQTYTMSDPGHGSGPAGPSRLSTPFVPLSTLHLQSVPVRQGARATWAYSEYSPLDAVLKSQARDGPVAFPTTSPHPASFMSFGRCPPPRDPEPLSFDQDLGRYPASLFGSLSRPRGVSTYSQSSAASHVTFGTLERPRIRKVSNKLRKTPNARRKSSLSISTTLESAMFAQSPSFSPAEPRPSQFLSNTGSPCSPLPESRQFEPSSSKRRSPSPRSRQRKKSILSRMFNFHRKKSSAALRKSEKRYTVEPLQLPPPDERVSIQEKPDGECKDGKGALKEWRECWWANKSQGEDGHGYDRRQRMFVFLDCQRVFVD
ncbi:hypothetical protein BDY19DRAFT_988919 [Irpex rosettiformis]|uniref:Uncharacterized protein n=1 Tax=Irpex rosettiformis TaxID=378272 RepID=A0ACB8UNC0_9APHY|nr:hypothetical protein BDY19DRAFT_988919 [Irpex rosettiformis]